MTQRIRLTERFRKNAGIPPQIPGILQTEAPVHPVTHDKDPDAEDYMNGDPSSWAEDPHPGPYLGVQPPSDPGIGTTEEPVHPAQTEKKTMPNTTPTKQASKAALQRWAEAKATQTFRIAKSLLGKTASTEQIEAQALSFMDLPDPQVISTVQRLASLGLLASVEDEAEDEGDDADAEMDKAARALLAADDESEKDAEDEEETKKEASRKMRARLANLRRMAEVTEDEESDEDEEMEKAARALLAADDESEEKDAEDEEETKKEASSRLKAAQRLRRMAEEAEKDAEDEEETKKEASRKMKAQEVKRAALLKRRAQLVLEIKQLQKAAALEKAKAAKKAALAQKAKKVQKKAMNDFMACGDDDLDMALMSDDDLFMDDDAGIMAEDTDPMEASADIDLTDPMEASGEEEAVADDMMIDDFGMVDDSVDPFAEPDLLDDDDLMGLYASPRMAAAQKAKKAKSQKVAEETKEEKEEDAEEADVEEKAQEKAASKRVASTQQTKLRPQLKKPGNNLSTLPNTQGMSRSAGVASEIKDLEKIWASSPDISKLLK